MSKENEFIEKLVHVNRITKVVKGGRRFGFSVFIRLSNSSVKSWAKQLILIAKANMLNKILFQTWGILTSSYG